MLDGRALRRTAVAALAVTALAGCGGDPATPVTPSTSSSAGPSGGASSAASSVSPSVAASPVTPSSTPSGVETETYANDLTMADGGQVSYTPLRWYAGQRAEDRCEKVGISSPTAWCHDYYYEKSGSTAEAELAADATIKLLDDEAELKAATAAQFRQAVTDESWPNFRLWLAGNEIQRVEQVYTP